MILWRLLMLPTVPRSMQDVTGCGPGTCVRWIFRFDWFTTFSTSSLLYLVYILHTCRFNACWVCLSTDFEKLCYDMNQLQKRHNFLCAELHLLGYDCRTRISPLTLEVIVTFDISHLLTNCKCFRSLRHHGILSIAWYVTWIGASSIVLPMHLYMASKENTQAKKIH